MIRGRHEMEFGLYTVPNFQNFLGNRYPAVPKILKLCGTQRYPTSKISAVTGTQRYSKFWNCDGYRSCRPLLWYLSLYRRNAVSSLHDNFSITPKNSMKFFSHPMSRTFGRPSSYFIEMVDFWTGQYVFPGVYGGKIRKQLGWPLTNELQSSFCNL